MSDEIPDTVEDGAPDPAQVELEAQARRQGWRPEAEYKGSRPWVDAKTFLDRGEQEWPILRENLRRMDTRQANAERELTAARTEVSGLKDQLKEQSSVMTELRDLSRTAAQRSYDQALADIAAKERKAVAEADMGSWDDLQRVRARLEETAPRPVTAPPVASPVQATPPPAPVPQITNDEAAIVAGWINDNSAWYNSDPEMRDVATTIHGQYRRNNPTEPLADNLDRVRQRMVQLYPDKFENPNRQRPSAVSAPTGPAPKPKGRTVADLPPEGKAALAKFKRQIAGYTDKEYLDLYFGSDGA